MIIHRQSNCTFSIVNVHWVKFGFLFNNCLSPQQQSILNIDRAKRTWICFRIGPCIHKYQPIKNSFVSIKISPTNLVFESVIQKKFCSVLPSKEVSWANLNAYKRILSGRMDSIHEVKTRENRIARGFSKDISKKFLQLSIQIFDLFFSPRNS